MGTSLRRWPNALSRPAASDHGRVDLSGVLDALAEGLLREALNGVRGLTSHGLTPGGAPVISRGLSEVTPPGARLQ